MIIIHTVTFCRMHSVSTQAESEAPYLENYKITKKLTNLSFVRCPVTFQTFWIQSRTVRNCRTGHVRELYNKLRSIFETRKSLFARKLVDLWNSLLASVNLVPSQLSKTVLSYWCRFLYYTLLIVCLLVRLFVCPVQVSNSIREGNITFNSAKIFPTVRATTVCLKKKHPDIFSCNLNKYFPISIIFGTSIT